MKAIVFHKDGSTEVLKLAEVEKPAPVDDEVLIRVRAASVNPMDYHVLRHKFIRRAMSTSRKLRITRAGRDVAGQVEAVGKNVTQFKAGDEIFGACNGSFAEYACARESACVVKPANISFEQAASLPVAGLTALQGLRDKAHVQRGQKILINGAAGGVGTFTVQLAKVFGAEVTGVCSTPNREMVRSIGADAVIDYTREDFTSNGQRYDLIFDLVSNHSFAQNKRALTPNGTYIGAGVLALQGSIVGMLKCRLTELVLSPFVSQKFTSFVAKLNQADLQMLGALVAERKVTPVIERRYKLSDAAEAVDYVGKAHARGKVIVVPEQTLSTTHF
jgi:NADPH:quinone reductase-like Zn-dependent oxidoreductase